MRLALGAKHAPQRLFGRGLADGARDRDDLRAEPCARRVREIDQSGKHVVDDQQRRVSREFAALRSLHHRKPRARLQRGFDKAVSVVHVALDGEIGFARRDGAAVDGEAGDPLGKRALRRSTHRLGHCRRCP